MVTMSWDQIALALYMTVLSGVLMAIVLKTSADTKAELKADIVRLENRMDTEFGRTRHEIASMRSDLTQVALAVGAEPREASGS